MTGAVVVVSYGSSALLARHLAALDPAAGGFRVVVVDNFSTPGERVALEQLGARHGWDVLAAPNRGFAAGMNLGAARAIDGGASSLLLLNPDLHLTTEAAATLLGAAAAEPAALVAPALAHPDGSPAFTLGALDLATGSTRTRGPLDPAAEPWLSGACLAVSAELWTRLGGMSEAYFMYWEDLELSFRCRRAGGRLVVRDDVRAVHEVGGTQGPEGKSRLYRYYNCRNRLLFARRNLGRREALRWLRTTPAYAWRVAARDGRRAMLRHPLGTVVPAIAGSVAGAAALLRRRG